MTRVWLIAAVGFLAYAVWGAFWIGVCAYPVAEDCVSAHLALLVTGFPLSLGSLLTGPLNVTTIAATALLGAIQWGAVAYGAARWAAKRRPTNARAGT